MKCIFFSTHTRKTYNISEGASKQSRRIVPHPRFWNSWIRHCQQKTLRSFLKVLFSRLNCNWFQKDFSTRTVQVCVQKPYMFYPEKFGTPWESGDVNIRTGPPSASLASLLGCPSNKTNTKSNPMFRVTAGVGVMKILKNIMPDIGLNPALVRA